MILGLELGSRGISVTIVPRHTHSLYTYMYMQLFLYV